MPQKHPVTPVGLRRKRKANGTRSDTKQGCWYAFICPTCFPSKEPRPWGDGIEMSVAPDARATRCTRCGTLVRHKHAYR